MTAEELLAYTATRLEAHIVSSGLRHTQERDMLLQMACSLAQPFDAEQLVKMAAESRITRATVYNFLNLLISARILHRLDRQAGNSKSLYQLLTDNSVYMHVVCKRCGRVSAFRDVAIENLVRARRYNNFLMEHYTLYVYGECKHCRKLVYNKQK